MRKKLSLLLLLLLIPALAYGWGMVIIGGGGPTADYCTDTASSATLQERFECGANTYDGDTNQEYASWTEGGTVDWGATPGDLDLGGTEDLECGGTAWENVDSGNITDVAEIWAGMIFGVSDLPAAENTVFRVEGAGDEGWCVLKLASDGKIWMYNDGGGGNDAGTYSADTRYYIKVRAKYVDGSNDECECWISTDPAAWGASDASDATGSWSGNPRQLQVLSERQAATNYFNDVRWSATEAHLAYTGY